MQKGAFVDDKWVNDSPRVKEEAHLFFQMRFLEVDDDRSNLDGVGFKKIGVKNNVMLCEY